MSDVGTEALKKDLTTTQTPKGVDETVDLLRKNLRDTPDRSPEDVKSELIEKRGTKDLRENIAGVSPEDTRSELLNREEKRADEHTTPDKEERKAQEADSMRQDREATARAWTVEQALARAARDITDHADLVGLGKQGEFDSFYLRSDMALQASANPAYSAALQSSAAELFARVQENEKENVRVDFTASKNDSNKTLDHKSEENAKLLADLEFKRQADKDLALRKEREAMQATQGLNSVDVQKKGKEIERDDLILPRSLMNNYSENDGKFFAKDSARLMFEDKGEKLATSTTNKQAIADMVTYARAKQWESIKLSGSQEFRREAWLQAESQGIKTQGYTPKEKDLADLKQLSLERQTNSIAPVAEREKEKRELGITTNAPRHDLNKNQAVIHVEATKSINENMKQLQESRKFESLDTKELSRLAYWRGVVMEENKMQPKPAQDEALVRFDKLAQNPEFLKKLEEKTQTTTQEKTVERERSITKQEPELSR